MLTEVRAGLHFELFRRPSLQASFEPSVQLAHFLRTFRRSGFGLKGEQLLWRVQRDTGVGHRHAHNHSRTFTCSALRRQRALAMRCDVARQRSGVPPKRIGFKTWVAENKPDLGRPGSVGACPLFRRSTSEADVPLSAKTCHGRFAPNMVVQSGRATAPKRTLRRSRIGRSPTTNLPVSFDPSSSMVEKCDRRHNNC